MQSLFVSGGIGFIFLMTCLGAATVFLFRKGLPGKFQQIFLGFAAGVMIEASIWSLLVPAIEEAKPKACQGGSPPPAVLCWAYCSYWVWIILSRICTPFLRYGEGLCVCQPKNSI